jgi:hypothetical protein
MDTEWYSVKGWFRWYMADGGATDRFEERVVLFRAISLDDALDRAEAESVVYCQPDPKANFRVEPVGIWHAHRIEDAPAEGVEVFSRRIETDLSNEAFKARYNQAGGGAV